jgi:hypothetical protein
LERDRTVHDVLPDADLASVAAATAVGGFVNAGQVFYAEFSCIRFGDFDALKGPVATVVGDPWLKIHGSAP